MVDENDSPPPNIVSFDDTDDSTPDQQSDGAESEQHTEFVSIRLGDWTTSRESLARLESELEASREDVRRAVDYARSLEQECDRLADVLRNTEQKMADLRSELDEERGRRRELQEQHAELLERLEELSGIRGRFHLERGRREQIEEQHQQLAEQHRNLKRDAQRLHDALDKARRQGFRVELGPLSIELK